MNEHLRLVLVRHPFQLQIRCDFHRRLEIIILIERQIDQYLECQLAADQETKPNCCCRRKVFPCDYFFPRTNYECLQNYAIFNSECFWNVEHSSFTNISMIGVIIFLLLTFIYMVCVSTISVYKYNGVNGTTKTGHRQLSMKQ